MYERLIADLIVKGILLCSGFYRGKEKKKACIDTRIHHPLVISEKNLAFIISLTFYYSFQASILEYNTDDG